MVKKYNVVVVGATGAVGEQMIKSLEAEKFPVNQIRHLSSKRSAGQTRNFLGNNIKVEEATPESFDGMDIVLFSAGGEVSKQPIPEAVSRGVICIDNTSHFRMNQNVPLVVPEVNPKGIKCHKGIIANPNCSIIQMVVVLEPLRKAFGLKSVIVSTYQAVSGAGVAAVEELQNQSKSILNNQTITPKVLPVKTGKIHHQITFNCIPEIDVFHENGFTLEEIKMINEKKNNAHGQHRNNCDLCKSTSCDRSLRVDPC